MEVRHPAKVVCALREAFPRVEPLRSAAEGTSRNEENEMIFGHLLRFWRVPWFLDPKHKLRGPGFEVENLKTALSGNTRSERESARARLRDESSHAIVVLQSSHRGFRMRSLEEVHSWKLRAYLAGRSDEFRRQLLSRLSEEQLFLVAGRSPVAELRIDAAIVCGNAELTEKLLPCVSATGGNWRRLIAALPAERLARLANGRSKDGKDVSDDVRVEAINNLNDAGVMRSVVESAASQRVREAALARVSDTDALRAWSSDPTIAGAVRGRLDWLAGSARRNEEWQRERDCLERAKAEFLSTGKCPVCRGTGAKPGGRSGFLSGGARWRERCEVCDGKVDGPGQYVRMGP